ncbi:hypothetical protein E7T09_08990 [Deinococcus sp. KSM4-11]|uniref:hypothetical protein n=1 Tax=Deinococcus sp. KSM4-11 TaxID=2568654 RepID=UPI0010A3F5C0|nr:hypothetical protein [Deinococcus sp. KSM4-11]THF87269.1 hypothetical protein E7T09_08990 [Deinococcus sp. KSM4-11]
MIAAFINPVPMLTPEPLTTTGLSLAGAVTQLLTDADLIPVTGLDENELLEVSAAFTSWQVLLYGAVVNTPDGLEDPAWRRLTHESQSLHVTALTLAGQAIEHISMFGHLGLTVERVVRGHLLLLIRVSHPYDLQLALDQGERAWADWLASGPLATDLHLVRDGLRMVMMPREINVESAVNYVIGCLGDERPMTVGVGASAADRRFLELCDLVLMPGDSAISWPEAVDEI